MKLLNKIFNGNKSPSLIEGGASITSRGGCKFAFFYIIPALFITFISTAAVADGTSGYVCDPSQRTYTSCNEGYVMFGGTGPGNSCILCDSGYYTTTENNTTACKSCSDETQTQYPLSATGNNAGKESCYQTCNSIDYHYPNELPVACYSQTWCNKTDDNKYYVWDGQQNKCRTCIANEYYYIDGAEKCGSCSNATGGQYPQSAAGSNNALTQCYKTCGDKTYYYKTVNTETEINKMPCDCMTATNCGLTSNYCVYQGGICKYCDSGKYYKNNNGTESCESCPAYWPSSDGGLATTSINDCYKDCPEQQITNGVLSPKQERVYNGTYCETNVVCDAGYFPVYSSNANKWNCQTCTSTNHKLVAGTQELDKTKKITAELNADNTINRYLINGTIQLPSAPKCVSNVYPITLKNGSATVETICQKYGTCFYRANGTSCAASYSDECPADSSITSVTPPKSAKVFTGYYTSSGSDPTIQANGQLPNNSMFTSSSVLYAHWGDDIGWTLQLDPSVLTKTDCSGDSCVANSDKGTNNGKLIDSCTSCSNGSFDSQNPKTFTLNSTGINAINGNPPVTITATVTLKDCDAGNYCTGLTLYSCNNGNLKSTTNGVGKSSLRDCSYWTSPLTLQDNTASKSISTSGNKFQMSPQTINHMVSLCDSSATNCD